MQIGIAHFPRAAMKLLEAQGRGFTHGHEKIISVPRNRAARMKQLFTQAGATEHGDDELSMMKYYVSKYPLQLLSESSF